MAARTDHVTDGARRGLAAFCAAAAAAEVGN